MLLVKVNVDQELDLASKCGIQRIQVIKFICEGKEIENISRNTPNCLSNTSLRR
jgi:thioredoxin-like negative regulator of GroEL